MKNYFKSTIAAVLISSFAFTSCLDLSSNATDAQASLKQTMTQSVSMDLSQMSCDYDNRGTTDMLIEQTGIVTTIASPVDSDAPIYVISIPNEGIRYIACNMPDVIKVEGMKITFDAEVKEIAPEERWIAHPLKLTKLIDMTSPGDDGNSPIATLTME